MASTLQNLPKWTCYIAITQSKKSGFEIEKKPQLIRQIHYPGLPKKNLEGGG